MKPGDFMQFKGHYGPYNGPECLPHDKVTVLNVPTVDKRFVNPNVNPNVNRDLVDVLHWRSGTIVTCYDWRFIPC